MKKTTVEKIVNAVNKEIAKNKKGYYMLFLTDNISVYCNSININENLVMFHNDGIYTGSCLVKSVDKIRYSKGV